MTTVYRDGVAVELTAEEEAAFEATRPKPAPKLDPADDTFKDEAPWSSLIE
jgi:hypothetical protein